MITVYGMIFEDSREELGQLTNDLEPFGFYLKFCSTIEEAFSALRDEDSRSWSILIIDSVASHGGIYSNAETGNARYTGLCLIKDIREGKHDFKVDRNIPILILTNVPNDEIMMNFIEKYGNSRIKYRRKLPLIRELIVDIRSLLDKKE